MKTTKSSPKKESKNKKDQGTINHNHLDKIGEIALYYGCSPHAPIEIKKTDIDTAKEFLDHDYIDDNGKGDRLPLHVEEKVALLRTYTEEEMHTLPQPVMLYFKSAFKNPLLKKTSDYPRYCDIEILGNSKSVAEATLIQIARAILAEEGYENICIDINSIGDKDSMARFTRDLTNYYRKHINDLHTECRQLLKKDPFELLACKNDRCKQLNENAPQSMGFLSESSRAHFQEVLEYLEALDIPYRINNGLIGNRKYCSETIFEIINLDHETKPKEQRTLAIGVRYDGLSKKMEFKREIPGVGLSILIKGKREELRKEVKKTKIPQVYFIQLGFEAKLASLKVIEILRKAKIPVYQSLPKDKLGAQVSMAEKNQTPFTIIIGKKEAMEGTAIVRDTATRSQETIKIEDLAVYLKKASE
ncbi:MAG: hypothetical protein HZA80_01965 [Candidatus Taylorbacteria bacterium]|nr:hypothetical protein [Candidatus Taylorbacteria bacterium]